VIACVAIACGMFDALDADGEAVIITIGFR
jgi:hypothetical protein